MQAWSASDAPVGVYKDYCKRTGADPNIFSFDLTGYGTLQMPQSKVYCLAGFSDSVFDIMALLEEDKDALLNMVEAIEI